MVAGAINCIKYLVFAFNLVFFLFGIALIAVGSYVQSQLNEYLNFFDTNVNGPAIVLIAVGLVIFVISFFGCCGAIKENYCMVLTFSILMMIILVCQIGGAIAGFVYSNNVKDLADKKLHESMGKYEEKENVRESWDDIQKELNCCGVMDPTDWKAVDDKFEEGPPQSCCGGQTCKYGSNPKLEGCLPAVEGILEKNVYYIGSVGIGLAVIQVTGIVLSCCLARAVKKEYEVA